MAINSPKNDFAEKHRWLTYADEPDTVYDGSKILDGSVTTDKLADYAVTTDKIDDESITLSKMDTDVLNLLEGNVKAFDTVADMQAATLEAGDICHTNGFHAAGDGGAAFYKVNASGTANGMDVLACGDVFANLVITESYVTPEQFGAYGDGVHDDSAVLSYLIKNNYSIVVANKYLCESSIVDSEQTKTIYLQMRGNEQHDVWYGLNKQKSQIIVADGVSLFKSTDLYGFIKDIAFIGQGANGQTSTTTQYLFDSCNLKSFIFENNYVYNFEAFIIDANIGSVTKIINNDFISCYYFAKCTTAAYYVCADSFICGNYINGGNKYNNNSCFQWQAFTASVLSNNFIDYYWTIFDPTVKNLRSNVSFYINSSNNIYEVFRYLVYMPGFNVQNIEGVFSNDQFTHVDPLDTYVSTKLASYEKQTITVSGTDYELDPYLIRCVSSRSKYFRVVFDNISINAYGPTRIIDVTGNSPFSATDSYIEVNISRILPDYVIKIMSSQTGVVTYYGNSDNLLTSNYVETLTSEPTIPNGYDQQFVPGCNYKYDSFTYKCIKYKANSSWHIGLIDNSGNIAYHN